MLYQIKTPVPFPLSGEQGEVYNSIMAGQSVSVNACAGSGKSHTARAIAKNYSRSVDSICFSRSLSDVESQTYAGFSHINSLNFHRRGLRLCGNVDIDNSKLYKLAQNIDGEKATPIADLTLCLKKEGVGIWNKALTPEQIAAKYDFKPELVPLSVKCLQASDETKNIVDFEDMLRFPVLFQRQSICNGLVILDEVQDFTPSSFVFLTQCLTTPETQVLMIGDPSRQCLQAFAGANAEIFDLMSEHFQCNRLSLTQNRRCAKSIVENAPFRGDMVALPDAPLGEVGMQQMATVVSEIESGKHKDAALLCETNAPLVKFGLSLIVKGIKIQMRLNKLSGVIYSVIKSHADTRKVKIGFVTELCRKDLEALAQAGEDITERKDIVDCVDILEQYCLAKGILKTTFIKGRPCHPIQQALALMVESNQGITLMTGHTSKGLEWPTVFYMPASVKPPKQAWQIQQNRCVSHVIATRAKLNFYTLG